MRIVKRLLAAAGAILAATAILAACGGSETARSASGATTVTTVAPPASTPADDTFPDEEIPATSNPEVWTGKVGETVVISDSTDTDVAKLQVPKVRFSRGDEYNRPEHGQFLGVYVKTKALQDGQDSGWGDIYVTINGHHYDGDAYAEGFSPNLDYVNLNAGETAEGWLVFDVPARHGQVVLSNSYDNSKIGTWSF